MLPKLDPLCLSLCLKKLGWEVGGGRGCRNNVLRVGNG